MLLVSQSFHWAVSDKASTNFWQSPNICQLVTVVCKFGPNKKQRGGGPFEVNGYPNSTKRQKNAAPRLTALMLAGTVFRRPPQPSGNTSKRATIFAVQSKACSAIHAVTSTSHPAAAEEHGAPASTLLQAATRQLTKIQILHNPGDRA